MKLHFLGIYILHVSIVRYIKRLICLYEFSTLGLQMQKVLLSVLTKSFLVTTVLNDF